MNSKTEAVGAVYDLSSCRIVGGHRRCEGIEIERDSPLLASPQGGGGCVIKKISRSHRIGRSRGGLPLVFILFSSENHPGFAISGGFAIFLDRSATPPCGDARRGLNALDSNSFTPSYDRPCSSGTSNYRNLHLIPNLDSCVSARIQHKTYRPFGHGSDLLFS